MSKKNLFCYAKLMELLVLLRRNILRQNNSSEAKEAFSLLLRRRIITLIVALGIILSFSVFAFAETILLKSGEKVEGKILERTDKYIKIDFYGVPIPYYFEDIESIDGAAPAAPAPEGSSPAPEGASPAPGVGLTLPQEKLTPEKNEYANNEFGVKLRIPEGWQVFDRNIHPEVFKTLLPTQPVMGTDLICALSAGEDWYNLNPLIMLIIQDIPDELRDAPADELVTMIGQNLRDELLPSGSTITEYPTVVTLNGNKVVRYMADTVAEGMSMKSVVYCFVKNKALYMVSCVTNADAFEVYKPSFENVAANVQIY